jgi:AAA domain, putative AbiEii toxin, Type IV TA system
MTYSDGTTTDILIPAQAEGSAVYNAQFRTMQAVVGLYLTSHRSIAVYQAVSQIPTTLASREQLLEQHVSEYRSRYAGSHTGYTATYRVKEALIALGTFGSGSDVLAPNPEAARLFHGFEEVLRGVLPSSLEFHRLRIDLPELVLETGTGPFPLDAVSGGIQAIIDVAWQVYLRAADDTAFVVLIDEPENHLHPELQRALLPGLLGAFPMAQFIVATHNPFVVTSVPDSHVYALRYTSEGRVEAVLLGGANKAGSSNEVLRDVLGLDSTMPLWVERRLDAIVDEYARDPSPERFKLLRSELLSLGMQGVFTDAVERIIDEKT